MKNYLVLMIVFLGCSLLRAEDVPQFRGIGGLGLSKEKDLPTHWTEKDNLRWKAALPGRGLSAPVIAGGRVYVSAASGYNQTRLHVLCFDVKDGKKLWERQLWSTGGTQCHPKTNMAAPTPVTDGERVYALFATCDLACLDREGNLLWYRSLVGDYPTVGNNVGMASSPVLCTDTVVLCLENAGESFAVGIDKITGENRWRLPRNRVINWATPLVIDNKGQQEVLFQSPSDLSAHDPATGKKKWAVTTSRFATIPSATFGDGVVFAPGDMLTAIRPPSEPKEEPQVLWSSKKLSSGYSSPTYYQGRIYTLTGRGVFNCADAATGKNLWDQRLEGAFSASPLFADGKIYLVSEEGITTVMEAGTEPKVLATNPLGETILASPVASGGALFLRSDQHLFCIGAKKN
jgi:outer membrane protein assembly factor BamB